MRTTLSIVGVIAALLSLSTSVSAVPVVSNGDFETGGTAFTATPGYAGDPGNPATIPGWSNSGAGRVAINPGNGSFGSPFVDNGNDATQVAILQVNPGPTTLSQSISGFDLGSTYAVTFNYNARNCCGDIPNLTANIGSKTTQISNILPVGGSNPYYSVTIPFTATAAGQTLTLTANNHGGDASAFIDNVLIKSVQQIPIVNPSFEANSNGGVGYGPISGWTGPSGTNPGGSGNFFIPGLGGPNAAPPDGAQVAFMQGAGILQQDITGLMSGTVYTLTFFDGHRNGDSGPGDTVSVFMGGVLLGTDTPNVTGYTPHTYTFTATQPSALLQFVHGNVTADQSIAIDDVAITFVPEPSSIALLVLGGAPAFQGPSWPSLGNRPATRWLSALVLWAE